MIINFKVISCRVSPGKDQHKAGQFTLAHTAEWYTALICSLKLTGMMQEFKGVLYAKMDIFIFPTNRQSLRVYSPY